MWDSMFFVKDIDFHRLNYFIVYYFNIVDLDENRIV